MCEKIKIDGKLIPIAPKKYRYERGFIDCDDILCEKYEVDCIYCPMNYGKVNDRDINIIKSNERLLEVKLFKEFWSITDLTFKSAKEQNGISCRDIQCFCMEKEIDCDFCNFNNDKIIPLKNIVYREID